MGGVEMDRGMAGKFVILDNDKARDKGGKGCQIECRVDVGAKVFLRGRVCRLEDEDCLGRQEDAGRIKELVKKRVSKGSRCGQGGEICEEGT